jgi:hypothetical protein
MAPINQNNWPLIFFNPTVYPIKLFTDVLFQYSDKLECFELSVNSTLIHYLQATLGAYHKNGVVKSSNHIS